VTAVVVAAWRQVQRDNTISTEPASTGGASRPSAPKTNPATSAASAQPQALFTPSVGEKSTKAELYEFATELGIEGRSKMNKSELLEAIRSAS
jgi:hypothetical protein